jgi:hypothetical protein
VLRFHCCCIKCNRAPAKPNQLVREFFPTSMARVPVGISAIAPRRCPSEDPTPRSIFSAAEDSLRRRVARSAALLPNLASSRQAPFDLYPRACDLPWHCDRDNTVPRSQGNSGSGFKFAYKSRADSVLRFLAEFLESRIAAQRVPNWIEP